MRGVGGCTLAMAWISPNIDVPICLMETLEHLSSVLTITNHLVVPCGAHLAVGVVDDAKMDCNSTMVHEYEVSRSAGSSVKSSVRSGQGQQVSV